MKWTFFAAIRIAGVVLAVISLSMLPSALVSVLCGEYGEALCFTGMAAAGIVLGLTLSREPHYYRKKLRISDGFLAAFNALIVTAAAWGLYEVTFKKLDEK